MKNINYSHFKIKSLNKEKIFNRLSKNFCLLNIKECENYIEFDVNGNEGQKIEKILNENNIKIVSVKHNGIKHNFSKIFKMWGVLIGCVLGITFCFVSNLFIFKIDVWGCENLNKNDVVNFVKQELNSNLKKDIETENLEIKLKNNFENISSVSVAIVGQSLIVNINEAVIPEEMQGEFQPLISQYDGLISDIELVQGTLNVKIGDVVKKGDILVFPYTIDADGEQMPVQPKAKIQAEIWIESQETFYEYEIKEERTGRKIECSSISLFGIEIYSNVNNNTFETFEVEKSSQYLSKNILLPFIYSKITFYETKTIEIERNFDDEKNNIIEKLRQKSLIYLSGNEIIVNESCVINESSGVYFISFVLTVEKDIGEGYGYQFS